MDQALRQRIVEATKDAQIREIVTFLYREHVQGAPFAGLKEMLFLHEAFEEARFKQLAKDGILAYDGTRYMVSAGARQVLDGDSTMLLGEHLR